MFRNPRSKLFFIKGLMTFTFFPIFFGLLILFDVFFGNGARERQNMEALQEHGVPTVACVIKRDIPNVRMCRCANDHRLIFEFHTNEGSYTHEIHVPDDVYEQNQLGDCTSLVYLPENPYISQLQSELDAFSTEHYWAAFFATLRLAALWLSIGFAILIVVLYLLSWLKQ